MESWGELSRTMLTFMFLALTSMLMGMMMFIVMPNEMKQFFARFCDLLAGH